MKYLLNFILIYGWMLGVCYGTPLDNAYKRRKQEAVKQLKQLIKQNEQNTQQGTPQKNWYIFNDDQPIRGQLKYFPELDQTLIKKLNDQLVYFNQTGVRLYIYFGGLKMMPSAGMDKNSQTTDLLEAKLERLGMSDFAKAKVLEEKLVKDIFRESGLHKFESILSINKHFGLEATRIYDKVSKNIRYHTTPFVMYFKSLASGDFLRQGQEKILSEVSKDEHNDKDAYKFTVDANAALQNFVDVCVKHLKEFQPTPEKPHVYAYMLTHEGVLIKDEYLGSNFSGFNDLQSKVFRFFYKDTPNGDYVPLIPRTSNQQNTQGQYTDAYYLKEAAIEQHGDAFARYLAGQIIEKQRPQLWKKIQSFRQTNPNPSQFLLPDPNIELNPTDFAFYDQRKFTELFKVEEQGSWAKVKGFYKLINQSPLTMTGALGKKFSQLFKDGQIPRKYWDFDHPQIHPFMQFMSHSMLNRSGRNTYVFLCGFYNGLLKQLEGVGQMTYMVSDYMTDGQTKQQLDKLMNEKSWWELLSLASGAISKQAIQHWDHLNDLDYYSIYLMGKDLAELAGLLVGVNELKLAYQGGKFLAGSAKIKLLQLSAQAKRTLGVLAQVKKTPASLIRIVTQTPKKLYQIRAKKTGKLLATVDDGVVKVEKWVAKAEGSKFQSGNLDGSVEGKFIAKNEKGELGICNKKGKACFVAGTLILTRTGYKKIEVIKVGDWVWSYNEQTGKRELKQVTKVFVRQTQQLVNLYLGNQLIQTTLEHPFRHQGKWVKANDLKAGDRLQLYQSSAQLALDSLARQDTSVTVYNFTVANNHNYFVGKQGVLVHNANCNYKLTNVTTKEAFHQADDTSYDIFYRAVSKEDFEKNAGFIAKIKDQKGEWQGDFSFITEDINYLTGKDGLVYNRKRQGRKLVIETDKGGNYVLNETNYMYILKYKTLKGTKSKIEQNSFNFGGGKADKKYALDSNEIAKKSERDYTNWGFHGEIADAFLHPNVIEIVKIKVKDYLK